MNLYPYNPKLGQRIQTDVDNVRVDAAFLAHIHIPGADAPAASATGVLAAANLGAEAQTITTGFTAPAVARNLQVKANVSGVTGTVTVNGLRGGEAVSEAFTLNGTAADIGDKTFDDITSVVLPVQVHTPAAQVETATVAGTVTTGGNAAVTVTAAGMTGSPKTIAVPVELGDEAADIALAIRTALAADEDVTALFDVSGETTAVVLTRKTPAANDDTLNIAIDDGAGDGASEGVTTAATSANTTPGVPYDIVSIGWGDKIGLPYKLAHNTVLAAYLDNTREGTAPAVVTSATDIESNTIDLHSDLGGTNVDIYLMV